MDQQKQYPSKTPRGDKAKGHKYSDSEISAIIGREIRNAVGYWNSTLSTHRRHAFEYYMGEPFGNEVEGRSQVVSTDVADVVEWILPQLLRIFTSGEKTVSFDPTGREDEAIAEQATDYVNYIVNKDNEGFLVLYEYFKDALLYKNGICKQYWEDREDCSYETYEGLDDQQLAEVVSGDDVEVEGFTPYETVLDTDAGPIPLVLNDVMVKRSHKDGRVRIEALPPEEFLIERRAKSIDEASFCAHRTRKTRSELVEMGYDRKVVDDLPMYNSEEYNEELVERHDDIEDWIEENSGDPSSDLIWVHECYVKLDMDDDGKSELWQVMVAGEDRYEILSKEPVDKAYFSSISPIIMPHRFHGRSIAELIMDLQLIKSTVLRQLLDNMYNQNNARNVVNTDQTTEDTFDDLLANRVGGAVRVQGDARTALMPMIAPSLHQLALPVLEYVDTIRENRTGVTKYNQGLDADSLNKTAQGINRILSQAAMRIELIARIFAETGVKDLFRNVLELVCKHQDRERVIKLREEWVQMDPRGWNHKMDMTVDVGLGTGDSERQFMTYNAILGIQKEALAAGGLGKMVTPKHIYNTLEKMVEAAGLKTVDPYFSEPAENAQMPSQGGDQAGQAMMQLEMAKLQLEQEKMRRQDDRERDKLDADIALRAAEIEAKYGQAVDTASIKAMVDMDRERVRADQADRQAQAQAQAQQQAPSGAA